MLDGTLPDHVLIKGFSLCVLSLGILASMRQFCHRGRTNPNHWTSLTIMLSGWFLGFWGILLITPLGFLLPVASFRLDGGGHAKILTSSVTVLAFGIVLGMFVARSRLEERRALLLVLANAAERGLSLAASCRGMSVRRADEMAQRTFQLARLLDSGVSLPLALRSSGHPLPVDAAFMVRLTAHSRLLGPALRESARHCGEREEVGRPLAGRLLYFNGVAFLSYMVSIWIAVRILPVLSELSTDHQIETPQVIQSLTEFVATAATPDSLLFWIVIALGIYLIASWIYLAFGYARGTIWLIWPLHRLLHRGDKINVLRGLALCSEQQLDISRSVPLLALHYPRWSVRRRLSRVADRVANGTEWIQALQLESFLSEADATLLRMEQQRGEGQREYPEPAQSQRCERGVAWSLRMLAGSTQRQCDYADRRTIALVTPVLVLAMTVPTLLLVLTIFQFVTRLIYNAA